MSNPMRCNERIPIDKLGMAETYCQRKRGHDGEHSIKTNPDDPFEAAPKDVQLVLPVRLAPARDGSGGVPPVPNKDQ
jgi:hypothetical protein